VRSIRYAPHHARSKATVWCARRLRHSPVSHGDGTGRGLPQLRPYARIPSAIPSADRKTTSRGTHGTTSPRPRPRQCGGGAMRPCPPVQVCTRLQPAPDATMPLRTRCSTQPGPGPPLSFPYAAPIVYRKERSVGR
jgi:hypothetical protein